YIKKNNRYCTIPATVPFYEFSIVSKRLGLTNTGTALFFLDHMDKNVMFFLKHHAQEYFMLQLGSSQRQVPEHHHHYY
ncbi:MAG: hypothetical protein ACK55I_28895, partial [bacterium]